MAIPKKKKFLKPILLSFQFLIILNVEGLVVGDLLYFGKFHPGESKKIKITLINDQAQSEQVDLKLCDYGCNCNGEHFYDSPGTRERSNAAWIALNTYRETIAPEDKIDIYFTIKIPDQSELQGSYWSVLLIEPNNILQNVKTSEGINIQVKVRYAYHIITDVGNGIAKLKVLKKAFQKIDDQDMLCIDILNTGNVFLKPKLTLKIFNQQGEIQKTLEEQIEKLYPNNPQRYFLNTGGLKGKEFKAFLLLDNGDKHLFGNSFDLEFQ